MLTPTEIKIFLSLTQESSVSEIAHDLDLSTPTVSKYVNLSIRKHNGLFTKRKQKRKVMVKRADTTHANLLMSIHNEYPRWDLTRLFTYSKLKIAASINQPKQITEISSLTDLSRQHVKSSLKTLSKLAIVIKKDNRYQLNPKNKLVNQFITNYYDYVNENRLKEITKDGIILWNNADEFLFKTTQELENTKKTALSVFPDHSLPLIGNEHFYYLTERDLDVKDHILHTILIDPTSRTYNLYAALLYQKEEPTNIMKRARIYDVEDHIKGIKDYIETRTKTRDYLPPWEEYESMAEDYGVKYHR